MKTVLATITFLCLNTTSYAYDCKDIQAIVKIVGEKKAIQMAREAGATEEQIQLARECLRINK